MAAVRLDVSTNAALERLAAKREQTKSEVVREAILRLAEEEGGRTSAYHRLQPYIGIADSAGRQLSTPSGWRLREILEERRRARHPD